MGRVVALRPGGEGLVIGPQRLNSLAAPTRLRPDGLSHPPRDGEGEALRYIAWTIFSIRAATAFRASATPSLDGTGAATAAAAAADLARPEFWTAA